MRTALLFLTLCLSCAQLDPTVHRPYIPPKEEQDLNRARIDAITAELEAGRAEQDRTEEQNRRCWEAIRAYHKAAEQRHQAAEAIGRMTAQEREDFARSQGEARSDRVCYREVARGRNASAMIRVPCGQPRHDYREMNAFAGPSLPPIPPECL